MHFEPACDYREACHTEPVLANPNISTPPLEKPQKLYCSHVSRLPLYYQDCSDNGKIFLSAQNLFASQCNRLSFIHIFRQSHIRSVVGSGFHDTWSEILHQALHRNAQVLHG